MLDVAVIQEPATAEPGSAVMPTARPGLPRQKVNDHLKEAHAETADLPPLDRLDGDVVRSDDEHIEARAADGASRLTSAGASGRPSARPAPRPRQGPHRIATAPHQPPSGAASNRKPHTRNP
ncbi:hypothetical protein ACFRFU_44370 [Streptomyces sp. NPDC056704]|uniref:hypothetical protein n=1 Tax=Streptomyces TaxID=1883 RepID=UPI0036C43E83